MTEDLAIAESPASEIPHLQTINAAVDRAAAERPYHLAIRQYDAEGRVAGSLTFSELAQKSKKLSSAIARRFSKGDNIAIWANNSLSWVMWEFAILRMGGVVVTLDPALRARDLQYLLGASEAKGIIMDRLYRGNSLPDALAEIRSELPTLQHEFFMDSWEQLSEGETPLEGDVCRVDDPALIVFTSGTTGKPKGVVLHQGGCTGNAKAAFERTSLSDGAPLLGVLPSYTVGGASTITLGALCTLRPQIIMDHFDAAVLIDVAAAEGFGWMPLVPAMLLPLVQHPKFKKEAFKNLEVVWLGGTTITPANVEMARESFGVRATTIYGQTESGGLHAVNMRDATLEQICNSVGRPMAGGVIRIADLQTGETVKRGVIGEIRERSPYVTKGYFRNEDASRELFDDQGFMKTGDLGMVDDDGLVRITGRLKEMLIRGGRNIYPREIEDVLGGLEGVAECAVVGVPHPRWGEEVACAVRAKDNKPIDFDAMRAYLEARIAHYKVPKMWLQVEDFPRGAQAKIRKMDVVKLFVKDEE